MAAQIASSPASSRSVPWMASSLARATSQMPMPWLSQSASSVALEANGIGWATVDAGRIGSPSRRMNPPPIE